MHMPLILINEIIEMAVIHQFIQNNKVLHHSMGVHWIVLMLNCILSLIQFPTKSIMIKKLHKSLQKLIFQWKSLDRKKTDVDFTFCWHKLNFHSLFLHVFFIHKQWSSFCRIYEKRRKVNIWRFLLAIYPKEIIFIVYTKCRVNWSQWTEGSSRKEWS